MDRDGFATTTRAHSPSGQERNLFAVHSRHHSCRDRRSLVFRALASNATRIIEYPARRERTAEYFAKKIESLKQWLEARRVVTRLCVNTERRKPLGVRNLTFILRHRASCNLLLGRYPRMYWLRSSAPIFAAMSGSSLKFSTENARPPVSSVIS